jgi:hypothetical protein
MKGSTLLFGVVLFGAGCTTVPPDPLATDTVAAPAPVRAPATEALLAEADGKLIAQDYKGALTAYAQFLTAAPDHPQAARIRATQTALERMLSFELELTLAQRTGALARREVSDRQTETERLKSEVTKLRADLERLRSIDLQAVRPETKK